MPLRDLLKKKAKITQDGAAASDGSSYEVKEPAMATSPPLPPPEFKFIRTTTDMEEVISPPSFPADKEFESNSGPPRLTKDKSSSKAPSSKRLFHLRKRPKQSVEAAVEEGVEPEPSPPARASKESEGSERQQHRLSKRLEDKLHIRSRSQASSISAHVPSDLPEIEGTGNEHPEKEAEWENRALLLAQENERTRPRTPNNGTLTNAPQVPDANSSPSNGVSTLPTDNPSSHKRTISNPEGDINIQEAIRLHEAGGENLVQSTRMLRRLADEQNNAMAQVLYGLALRHGWGCDKDEPTALSYLSLAASNSALVESTALSSGTSPKGGPAKGELVLAIYELGNSFRWGWGCEKDALAARKYYETAANLGDTDAMSEIAWCYLQGFGGRKDKFMAAKYLRMAEAKGVSEPGNSWIWKDKYSPQAETTTPAKLPKS